MELVIFGLRKHKQHYQSTSCTLTEVDSSDVANSISACQAASSPVRVEKRWIPNKKNSEHSNHCISARLSVRSISTMHRRAHLAIPYRLPHRVVNPRTRNRIGESRFKSLDTENAGAVRHRIKTALAAKKETENISNRRLSKASLGPLDFLSPKPLLEPFVSQSLWNLRLVWCPLFRSPK